MPRGIPKKSKVVKITLTDIMNRQQEIFSQVAAINHQLREIRQMVLVRGVRAEAVPGTTGGCAEFPAPPAGRPERPDEKAERESNRGASGFLPFLMVPRKDALVGDLPLEEVLNRIFGLPRR